jgi:hypothetical protein
VSYTEGEYPPDIYLKYNSNEAGIELTKLSPNLYKDKVSIDVEKITTSADDKIMEIAVMS